jgi:hypothetical protein
MMLACSKLLASSDRHGAGLDQLPGQGLVLGDLNQLARAQDVAARVPDLADEEGAIHQPAAVQVVPMPRSFWLMRDWTWIFSFAFSMARRRQRA